MRKGTVSPRNRFAQTVSPRNRFAHESRPAACDCAACVFGVGPGPMGPAVKADSLGSLLLLIALTTWTLD